MVLFLAQSTLESPICLLEICIAMKNKIPIASAIIEEEIFSLDEAIEYTNNLETRMKLPGKELLKSFAISLLTFWAFV